MRTTLLQFVSLWFGVCSALDSDGNLANQPIYTNSIQRIAPNPANTEIPEFRALKKVFLSNRSVTCNDGSQAGFYLRKSHTSKKWIIFLEGGWYCYDHYSCRNRWIKQRHYMTSSKWPETKDVGGILSPNSEENPFWWDANHVFVPYCTSDSWSGSRKSEKQGMFSFMGSAVVLQVVRDLLPLGLENSTELLLAGSSAGGTGVMLNLDFVQELLHEQTLLKHIKVRGVTDSGWFLDKTPHSSANKPVQNFAPLMKPAVDAVRKGMELWQGRVPRRCRENYLNEPWRCYFGYRLYPTLKSPLFVFQWLFDEAQLDAAQVGAPATQQQWDTIHQMGDALRSSFRNVSAVFAPACISHSVLTKREWLNVKIDDVSIAEALHCWEQKSNRKKNKKLRSAKLKMLGDQPRLRKKENRLDDVSIAEALHCWEQKSNRKKNKKLRSAKLKMLGDQPRLRKKENRRKHNETTFSENRIRTETTSVDGKNKIGNNSQIKNKRRRRKKNKKNRRRKNGHNEEHTASYNSSQLTTNTLDTLDHRPSRSVLQKQRRSNDKHCVHRRLERCSWPQCNHSCPKLHNPFTGEEMDFIELLKSFGLDMESVAKALGIDMETLNNMDHAELLNLLTQQSN